MVCNIKCPLCGEKKEYSIDSSQLEYDTTIEDLHCPVCDGYFDTEVYFAPTFYPYKIIEEKCDICGGIFKKKQLKHKGLVYPWYLGHLPSVTKVCYSCYVTNMRVKNDIL